MRAAGETTDIQLNVKGLKTLEDSFKDYIQVETMDGDNKYMAEGYGLQVRGARPTCRTSAWAPSVAADGPRGHWAARAGRRCAYASSGRAQGRHL